MEKTKGRSAPAPRFSRFWLAGFETFFLPLRKILLRKILVANRPQVLNAEWPLLLVGNHASNWDGFLFREVQRRIRPGAAIYSIMLERVLREKPIFRKIGGLGVETGNAASGVRLLRRLSALRAREPGAVISLFPEGKLVSPWRAGLRFESGILGVLRALAPVTVLPIALNYEHLLGLTPTAILNFGSPWVVERGFPTLGDLQAAVQRPLRETQAWILEYGEELERNWLFPAGREIWKA